MDMYSIGKNIRKYRSTKGMRQEDLAEKTELTAVYIGMLERGEKIPSLETFIKIANALEISSDMLLCEVLDTGYKVRNSIVSEKLDALYEDDRNKIYDVIDTMIKHSKKKVK
ncbi:MAG: helix-turn-helix transcriptional regulator [Clostridia bacterium]|nr:helix-turn-helix transcriptional regulator [Clostridia bacterium]